ncbi:MAG: amikacin resistance N-acetyltransferase Eis2 [Acidimicrobiales bacterium]
MTVEIRGVDEHEYGAFSQTLQTAFGSQPTSEEVAGWRGITELDRSLAAFDGSRLVATAGAFSFDLTVPGDKTIPAAGVTSVGVLPSHRRRGLLRSLMIHQLDDIARGGEALAMLTASESVIYGRFGYGIATRHTSVSIDPRRSAFTEPLSDPGRVELLDPAQVLDVVPHLHDKARRTQPGDIARSPAWWVLMVEDPEWYRRGKPRKFWAQHLSESGVPDGYVAYRVAASSPHHGMFSSEVEVITLVALNGPAELALWRFVLDIDLAGQVTCASRPLDEPLRWRLSDPRQLQTTSLLDQVWVRLLDIPKALGGRAYGLDGAVVLAIHDPLRPDNEGAYLLETVGDHAQCTRTTRSPDLELGVADLGAAYLGQALFNNLAKAGRIIEHRPGALRRADQLFGSVVPPFSRSGF